MTYSHPLLSVAPFVILEVADTAAAVGTDQAKGEFTMQPEITLSASLQESNSSTRRRRGAFPGIKKREMGSGHRGWRSHAEFEGG